MHLDGYNAELKIAFEYQGKHHYEQIQYFHKNDKEFQECKKRDEYKKIMCNKNGIKLIEIGFDEMQDEILRECKKLNIIFPKLEEKINWREFKISSQGCLEELKEIARLKGGECISFYWFGAKQHYEFKCSEGHFFKATPSKNKGTPKRPKGSWCPKCMYKNLPQNQLKYSKAFLDQLAIKRGGRGSNVFRLDI